MDKYVTYIADVKDGVSHSGLYKTVKVKARLEYDYLNKSKVAMKKFRQLLGMSDSSKSDLPYVTVQVHSRDPVSKGLLEAIAKIDEAVAELKAWVKDHEPILEEL